MSILDYTKDVFKTPQRYAKFWTTLAGAAVTYLTAKYGMSPEITLLTGFLTAAGVFGVKNTR